MALRSLDRSGPVLSRTTDLARAPMEFLPQRQHMRTGFNGSQLEPARPFGAVTARQPFPYSPLQRRAALHQGGPSLGPSLRPCGRPIVSLVQAESCWLCSDPRAPRRRDSVECHRDSRRRVKSVPGLLGQFLVSRHAAHARPPFFPFFFFLSLFLSRPPPLCILERRRRRCGASGLQNSRERSKWPCDANARAPAGYWGHVLCGCRSATQWPRIVVLHPVWVSRDSR
ncbi:hypothetical protein GQ53DRAFT_141629 [Thozetella sp. PMI_491]|nr:hypothetical protein GQ53DRAFT_141629 [Thozetella sp. PMI_491]